MIGVDKRGIVRLKSGSPAIDAADGSAAPQKDFFGKERIDDPTVKDAAHCMIYNRSCAAHADLGAVEYEAAGQGQKTFIEGLIDEICSIASSFLGFDC